LDITGSVHALLVSTTPHESHPSKPRHSTAPFVEETAEVASSFQNTQDLARSTTTTFGLRYRRGGIRESLL